MRADDLLSAAASLSNFSSTSGTKRSRPDFEPAHASSSAALSSSSSAAGAGSRVTFTLPSAASGAAQRPLMSQRWEHALASVQLEARQTAAFAQAAAVKKAAAVQNRMAAKLQWQPSAAPAAPQPKLVQLLLRPLTPQSLTRRAAGAHRSHRPQRWRRRLLARQTHRRHLRTLTATFCGVPATPA